MTNSVSASRPCEAARDPCARRRMRVTSIASRPTHRSLQVELDATLTPSEWLRLDVDVIGRTSGLSTMLTVFLTHQPLDINGDGRTNMQDATAFGDVFRGSKDPNLIDMNCDGLVNVQDATAFGTAWTDANGTSLPAKPKG